MIAGRIRVLAGVFALGLGGLLLGCRGSGSGSGSASSSEQAEGADSGAGSSARGPGLRSAVALPGVRPLALPDPIGGSSPSVFDSHAGLTLAWMSQVGEPSLKLASLLGPPDHNPPDNSPPEWSEVQVVVANPRLLINWADVPALGETGSGRLVVAWPESHTDDPSAGYGLRVAPALDDGSFAPESAWSPDDVRRGPESGFASFVTTPAGLRLIWLDGRELTGHGGHDAHAEGPSSMQLRSVSIDDDGGPVGPSQVLDDRTCECCKLGVGQLGGQAFAAYRDRSETEVRDIFVAGPELPASLVAHDGWTLTGCPVNGPAVAAANGRAHVAWFTGAQDRSATWIASADQLSAFEPPTRFDLGLPGGRVDLLALPDGDVLISWLELDPANPGLAALLTRRYRVSSSAPARLGPAFIVAELGAARDWGFPRAARVGDEVVWVFTDPTAADGQPRLEARIAALPPA